MKFNNFKILFSLLTMLSLAFVSCEEDGGNPLTNNVSLEQYKYVGIEEDQTLNVEGRVFASEASSSDRTFNLLVDASTTHDPMYYAVPTSVTIPAGETVGVFEVSITGTNLGTGKTIVLALEQQAGVYIPVSGSDTETNSSLIASVDTKTMTFDIKQACFSNKVNLEIVTDRYGSETTWELYSDLDLGTPIATGGPYADQGASGAYPQPVVNFCLEDGSYTFVVYDAYNDGMDSGYGNGFYRLTKLDGSGNETVIAQNGVFTSNDVVNFMLP